ncbi:MAG TPA: type IV secretory system conjugative DNA transfer family protein [Pirellulales bacterium]
MLTWLSKALAAYCALLLLLAWWPTSLLGLIAFAIWRIKHRRGRQLTDLGSARWAKESDLVTAGMLGATSGLILGRLPRQRRAWRGSSTGFRRQDALVRMPNAVHTTVFGPSGAGKGVSFVIPTLLTESESCVVLDFKGELARCTAEHRRKYFGHQVVLLDPYCTVTQKPDTFNPLDFIKDGHPLAIDDCNDLASALVVRTGEEKDPHWSDSAEACIAAVAATVVGYGKSDMRSLQTVREILSHPERLEMAIKLMCESNHWNGMLAQMGGQLMHFMDKEKASVLSSTLRHLRFLGTPAIAASTSSSSFDPAQLRRGKLTVYLILPPERAQAQAGLLRMWVGSLLRACVREGVQ